jgi:ferrous iron transport protein A
MGLGQLKKGTKAKIARVSGEPEMNARFLAMGLLEGNLIEVLHEAPFGKDPIAVRVRGALIALRRNEANFIEVEVIT